MPKPRLIRTHTSPYHVCARANNKEWFYLNIDQVWEVFCELWAEATEQYALQIHAFVLMSNHYHALLSTPNSNLDEAMLFVMREAARRINKRAGRINHIFGGPYRWSLIAHRHYYEHAVRYVYQNPVKAGIVHQVEEYPYSSLRYLLNRDDIGFPVIESIYDRESVMDLALWQKLDYLNTHYNHEEYDCIRRGLKHAVFRVHPERRTGRLPITDLRLSSN